MNENSHENHKDNSKIELLKNLGRQDAPSYHLGENRTVRCKINRVLMMFKKYTGNWGYLSGFVCIFPNNFCSDYNPTSEPRQFGFLLLSNDGGEKAKIDHDVILLNEAFRINKKGNLFKGTK